MKLNLPSYVYFFVYFFHLNNYIYTIDIIYIYILYLYILYIYYTHTHTHTHIYIYKIFIWIQWSIFSNCSISITPENIRKPMVRFYDIFRKWAFLMFLGENWFLMQFRWKHENTETDTTPCFSIILGKYFTQLKFWVLRNKPS